MKRTYYLLFLSSWFFTSKGDAIFYEETIPQAKQHPFIVINLGADCAPGLHTRRHGIRTAAYPFDWCFTPYATVMHCIKNQFADFFQKENLVPSTLSLYRDDLLAFMKARGTDNAIENSASPWVLDKKLAMVFNHDFSDRRPATINAQYQANYEKYQRRIHRFYESIKSGKKIYFIRYQYITKSESIELYQLLKSTFASTNFTLIVIADDEAFKTDWQIKGIRNFYSPDNGINRYYNSPADPFWQNLCRQIQTDFLLPPKKKSSAQLPKALAIKKALQKNQRPRSANARKRSAMPWQSNHS